MPSIELSGTFANVPDLRARGGFTFERGGFSGTAIVNYVSDEIDSGANPVGHIGSWTTADANVAYEFNSSGNLLRGVRAALSVTNIFDRDPPYAFSPSLAYQGIYFDSTNTSAIGRYVSLTLRKSF